MDYIGIYPICNTASLLLHEIDYIEDKVLASINGENKEWCDLIERQMGDEFVTGFEYGLFFVPLKEVMRA